MTASEPPKSAATIRVHATTVAVGLISDTHGFVDPRVLAAIAGCAVVVHAGDIGNAEVLEQLARGPRQVVAVRGNNDTPVKWPAAQRATLESLPREAAVELPGGRLLVVHGDRHNPAARRHRVLREAFADARAVVYGHSHRLVADRAARPWVLNPGAGGRNRTFGGPSCLIVHATERHWRVTERRFAPAPR